MPEAEGHARLPRNFHRTFKPERQYLGAMLRFAATGGEGDIQEIGRATGIPTGASTGKVPAILDYCRGMGLVTLGVSDRAPKKSPHLTPFGRVVLIEDPFLKLPLTQWLAHFHLCSPRTGADIWYHTFVNGAACLGPLFQRTDLEGHLSRTYGVDKGGLIGPLVGTYEDDAAFKACGVLTETSGEIRRRAAPVVEEMARAYGAWILSLLTLHFPGVRQVPLTELDRVAGWHTIPGWDGTSRQRALELMVRKGIVDVDRHMEPWLIAPSVDAEQAWPRIYEDLL